MLEEEEKYLVELRSESGLPINATFTLNDVDPDSCMLTLHYDQVEIAASASDYFEALCQIRERLEELGLRPFCYGASLNVYPSAMGRDMGAAGRRAYKMTIGRYARTKDLVDIFDTGPDVNLATVAEQKAFVEKWLYTEKV